MKNIKILLSRNKVLLAVLIGIFYYYIAARILHSYDFDIWDQQTWGYTAIFDNPFVVHIRNIGKSGVSVYPPLADIFITLEAFASFLWNTITHQETDVNILSPSFKVIRRTWLGIAHFLFSIFLYRVILRKSTKNSKRAFQAFLIWLFNPVSLLVGTVWGQLDEVMIIFVFLTLYFLSKEKLIVSGMLLACVILFKVQGIIIVPIYILILVLIVFVKNRRKINKLFLSNAYHSLSIAGFTFFITLLVISLPYIIYEKEVFFRVVFMNLRLFPFVHMGAFNLWMLLFGDLVPVHDDTIIFGNISYHQISAVMFILLSANILFVGMIDFIRQKLKVTYPFILEILYLIYGAFFLFLNEVHERYIVYMYLPYLLLFIFKLIKGTLKRWEYIFSSIFTIIASCNLFYVLYKQDLFVTFGKIWVDSYVGLLSAILIYLYFISLLLFSYRNSLKEEKS